MQSFKTVAAHFDWLPIMFCIPPTSHAYQLLQQEPPQVIKITSAVFCFSVWNNDVQNAEISLHFSGKIISK